MDRDAHPVALILLGDRYLLQESLYLTVLPLHLGGQPGIQHGNTARLVGRSITTDIGT